MAIAASAPGKQIFAMTLYSSVSADFEVVVCVANSVL